MRRITQLALLSFLAGSCLARIEAQEPVNAPSPPVSQTSNRLTLITLPPKLKITSVGLGSTVAVSPDGQTIAFVGDVVRSAIFPNQTEWKLYVKRLGESTPRLLQGTEGAFEPFFSPDGKWIGFARGRTLERIPVGQGAPVLIATLSGLLTGGASWAPNGNIVVSIEGRIGTVPSTGGAVRELAPLDTTIGEESQAWPVVLPDGETALYTSAARGLPGGATIRAVSLQTGREKSLGLYGSSALGVVDGQLLYIGSSDSLMVVPFDVRNVAVAGSPTNLGTPVAAGGFGGPKAALSSSGTLIFQDATFRTQVLLVDDRGSARLLLEKKRMQSPRFSPDGKQLAVSMESTIGTDVWIYKTNTQSLRRLTNAGRRNAFPEWSPDGKRVVFASNRDGINSLWSQPAHASGAAKLLQRSAEDGVISPDGRTLVYTVTTPETRSDIWYRSITSAAAPKPFATSKFNETAPRISPDGQWVAFTSNEGRREVFVKPLAVPELRYKVSDDGGTAPIWSRDGRTLFYIKGDEVIAATIEASPTFHVTGRSVRFKGDFVTDVPHANYDLSADGSQLLIVRRVGNEPQTFVMPDVRDLLSTRRRH
jgi:serine/threonine-protein kinase